MWVTRHSGWNQDNTKLEKFLVERIIQRCDYQETISKKHRTVNGFTQLKELIRLGELTKKRIQTLRTLKIILFESKSQYIKQNILNDNIIDFYFTDLKQYIKDFDVENFFKNDSIEKIDNFLHDLRKFLIQLEKNYFQFIKIELKKIDFSDEQKQLRSIEKVSDLIDIAIPYLLNKGYSISTFNQVFRRWIETRQRIDISKILDFFDFSETNYELLIYLGNNKEKISNLKNVVYRLGSGDIRSSTDVIDNFDFKKRAHVQGEYLYYSCSTIDPTSFVRNSYDKILKSFVIHKQRSSLSIFNEFFNKIYWRKPDKVNGTFKSLTILGDPIIVNSRKNTLITTLIAFNSDFNKNTPLDFIKNNQLKRSLYYYNLGLGSKSIENSLSLFWTSIESILPYRTKKSDIENIRDTFSKVFSFGAFTRDIQYIIDRLIVVNKVNNNCFKPLGIEELPKNSLGENLHLWLDWLTDKPKEKFKSFDEVSSLLAYEYSKTIRTITEGRLQKIYDRILASKTSIDFQLQRIYLHRNQIVHSGDYINEYTNLWTHLEWYLGKFLFYIIQNTELNDKQINIHDLFVDLESNYEYCLSYLEKNKKKDCQLGDRVLSEIIKIDWQ